MFTFLIVDDHKIIHFGLSVIIKKIFSNASINSAFSKSEALTYLNSTPKIDIVILDINVPDYSCEMMIENCKIKHPECKILILSMNSENLTAERFYKLGIDGYLNKNSEETAYIDAITKLTDNKKYFSQEYLYKIATQSFSLSNEKDNPIKLLSNREFEVYQLLIQGYTVSKIAEILIKQPTTIGTYKKRIFEKFQVSNTIELLIQNNIYSQMDK